MLVIIDSKLETCRLIRTFKFHRCPVLYEWHLFRIWTVFPVNYIPCIYERKQQFSLCHILVMGLDWSSLCPYFHPSMQMNRQPLDWHDCTGRSSVIWGGQLGAMILPNMRLGRIIMLLVVHSNHKYNFSYHRYHLRYSFGRLLHNFLSIFLTSV